MTQGDRTPIRERRYAQLADDWAERCKAVEREKADLRAEVERLRESLEAFGQIAADLVNVADRHGDELEIHSDDPIIEAARDALRTRDP